MSSIRKRLPASTCEGNILEIGVLSTKIKTLYNEEVTIPNAVLLSVTTTNFSRYAREEWYAAPATAPEKG
ncbi:mechanosensitive ion channel domain-containing protein [Sulfurimonas sp. HSL3-7]|uniref:mechanosensitive ion channel domain-containing protein n=1 Tax=Sulfonitrofixus jiaomeiensis TaxID=3131938 RepID=UPI0031F8ED32